LRQRDASDEIGKAAIVTLPKIVFKGMAITDETACQQIKIFACSGTKCPRGIIDGKIPLSKKTISSCPSASSFVRSI
jgi:hypothetical protein